MTAIVTTTVRTDEDPDDDAADTDQTPRTDDEVRTLLSTAAYYAVRRLDKTARDKRYGISKLQTPADVHQNERADMALIAAWSRVAAPPKELSPSGNSDDRVARRDSLKRLLANPTEELTQLAREAGVEIVVRKETP